MVRVDSSTARQSSTIHPPYYALRAIDQEFTIAAHTNCTAQHDQWLEIEYVGCHLFEQIVIYPDPILANEPHIHRMDGAQIAVLNDGDLQYPCGVLQTEMGVRSYTINCKPPAVDRCGDRVRISGANCIHVVEVESYEYSYGKSILPSSAGCSAVPVHQ